MITPELIAYTREELTKGKRREEIRASLVTGGGWSEADLNEAFRIVIPMQGFSDPTTNPHPILLLKIFLTFVVFCVLCVVFWWFYHDTVIGMLNSLLSGLK